jgi:hypothetical protein
VKHFSSHRSERLLGLFPLSCHRWIVRLFPDSGRDGAGTCGFRLRYNDAGIGEEPTTEPYVNGSWILLFQSIEEKVPRDCGIAHKWAPEFSLVNASFCHELRDVS